MKKVKRVWTLINDRGETCGSFDTRAKARKMMPITMGRPRRIVSATLTWTEPKPKRGKR